MIPCLKTVVIGCFIFCLLSSGIFATESNSQTSVDSSSFKRRLGLGFTYLGGQIRYGFKKVWSVETRYLTGNADSNDGTVNSGVIGFRGYWHFRTDKNLQLYTGAEGAYTFSSSNNYSTSGFAFGGFGGVEYYILPRLSIGLDIGPYYLSSKEKITSTSDSGVDFILNSFVNFYIF